MKTIFAGALLIASTSALANEKCEHLANLAGLAYQNHIAGFSIPTVRKSIADNCRLSVQECIEAASFADMVSDIPRYKTWLWEPIFNSVYSACIKRSRSENETR